MQEQSSEFDFNVYEVALMGRNPHKGLFDRDTEKDFEIVDQALEQVCMAEMAERNFYTLSGGEKQPRPDRQGIGTTSQLPCNGRTHQPS